MTRRIQEATELMTRFAERTGVTGSHPPRRYLWTDAFAVCNFLELNRATDDRRFLELARALVDQVHHVLGRFAETDVRRGWLSGRGEAEGAAHPTEGGLRIGKPLPERGPDEHFDEELEWDRDGQYFHYLTKWMHALDQLARFTQQPSLNQWARELAVAAYRAFSYLPPRSSVRRMVWKRSVDLSRVLVPSMGHHDPLDGLITCAQLQVTAAAIGAKSAEPGLAEVIEGFAKMVAGLDLATADPLGLGSLLMDAVRLEQILGANGPLRDDLLVSLLSGALEGLHQYGRHNELGQAASRRLAFRELGLAIGLSALEPLGVALGHDRLSHGADLRALHEALSHYVSLGDDIEAFWREPKHRMNEAWTDHQDINDVMLATALVPRGYLKL